VLERAPLLGEFVLHPYRRFRNHRAGQDPFGFQLAQALRQHAVADLGDGGPQLGEAHPPVQQQLDDRASPAAANELDRPVEPDAELGFESHANILAK
jgi:hypothetical protein